MGKEECPKCKRRSLRFRKINEDYICDNPSCEAIFDKDMNESHVSGKNVNKDEFGNYYNTHVEKKEDVIIQTKTYFLEPNKTTLRGGYNKLKTASNCKYPERLSCNSEIGSERCRYMRNMEDLNPYMEEKDLYKLKLVKMMWDLFYNEKTMDKSLKDELSWRKKDGYDSIQDFIFVMLELGKKFMNKYFNLNTIDKKYQNFGAYEKVYEDLKQDLLKLKDVLEKKKNEV